MIVVVFVIVGAVDVDVTLFRSLRLLREPKTLNRVGSDFCLLFY